MENMISTKNLTKTYKKVRAVDQLNLSIKKGEIFGFLGLNGAGKTSTVKMLLGMVTPTTGTAYLQGKQVQRNHNDLWNKVGYLVETPYSYPELTVKENLEIFRQLRGIKEKEAVNRMIKRLKLERYAHIKAGDLSMGNAQRLGIAKALIHRPEILLLDEPTNGLDPEGIVEVRKLLLDLAQNQGVTILISSHKLDEIAKIATHIGIIHDGKLIKEIESYQLKKQLKKTLLVDGLDKEAIESVLSQAGYQFTTKKDELMAENSYLEIIDTKAIQAPEKIATLLVNKGVPPQLLKVREENLEDYFLRILKESRGDKT